MQLFRLNPITRKKVQRFRSIKRGYWSFCLLIGAFVISLFAELLVNNRALVVKYDGSYHFPTYTGFKSGKSFGMETNRDGQAYDFEVDYRELKAHFQAEGGGNWAWMPLVPFDPVENDFQKGVDNPAPPDFQRGHFLGTDKTGRDVLARLLYGFRIAMVFALIFMLLVYGIGVVVGCVMGYFGGKVDLLGQRLVEIWSNIPFLYMVIILVSIMPAGLPTWIRVGGLLLIMVAFSWTGMTYYMRTAVYREKARDYVAAAQLLGAGTPRIIFSHLLPNTISTLVTFMPFTMAMAIASLTALDFLGFGLPPPTPSWGEMLAQGTENLHAHWIVSSAFVAMVLVLTLVTFIGEGVRESFDPKKYTVYK